MNPQLQRLHDAAGQHDGNPTKRGDGFEFRCPCHDDRKASAGASVKSLVSTVITVPSPSGPRAA